MAFLRGPWLWLGIGLIFFVATISAITSFKCRVTTTVSPSSPNQTGEASALNVGTNQTGITTRTTRTGTSSIQFSTQGILGVPEKTLWLNATLGVKIPLAYSISLAPYDNWNVSNGQTWGLRATPQISAWGRYYPEVQVTDLPFSESTFCVDACGGLFDSTTRRCSYSRRFGVASLPVSKPQNDGGYEICRWEDYHATNQSEATPFYRYIGIADFKKARLYLAQWVVGYDGNNLQEPIHVELLVSKNYF